MTINDVTTSFSRVASILLGSPTREPEVGALVLLTGGDHVGKRAFIQNVRISPYYAEEKVGIWRAYCYSEDWDGNEAGRFVDWVLIDQLEVIG